MRTRTLRAAGLIAFGLLLLAGARLHYFWMPGNYAKAYDGAWHYAYQAQLAREAQGVPPTAQQSSRHEVRTLHDRVNARVTLAIAKVTGGSQMRANLIMSCLMYLTAIVSCLVLGRIALGGLLWACLFTVLCLQSPYGSWLSWSAAVTKMWGYALFPLALGCLTYMTGDPRRRVKAFIGAMLLIACVYAPTIFYTGPALFVAAGAALLFSRKMTGGEKVVSLAVLAAAGLLLLGVLYVSRPAAIGAVPDEEIITFFSPAGGWWVPYGEMHPMVRDLMNYGMLPAAAALLLAWWAKPETRRAIAVAITVGLLLALTAQIDGWLSSKPGVFRSTFLIRAVTYGYVPAALLACLAVKAAIAALWARRPSISNRALVYGITALQAIAVVALAAVILWKPIARRNKGMATSLTSAQKAWEQIRSGTVDPSTRFYTDAVDTARFIRTLPPGATVLMPATQYQWDDIDMYLEAESGRRFSPMSMDLHLSLVEHRLTQPFYRLNKRLRVLNEILGEKEAREYIAIATEEGADYIFLHSNWLVDAYPVTRLHRNGSWTVVSRQDLERLVGGTAQAR
jgi:hypothetical protein